MTAEQRKILVKSILLLLALYLLQTSVFSRLRLWGVSPLILPLFAVGIGLFRGGLAGGCWGLAAGVLCDISLGGNSLLFTVFLTACGFFSGFMSQFIVAKGFPSFFVLSLTSLVIAAFLQMFSLLVYYGTDPIALVRTGLLQTLYSLFFTIPVYLNVRWSCRTKTRAKVKYAVPPNRSGMEI
jgi:rod shape-determining protein MreD